MYSTPSIDQYAQAPQFGAQRHYDGNDQYGDRREEREYQDGGQHGDTGQHEGNEQYAVAGQYGQHELAHGQYEDELYDAYGSERYSDQYAYPDQYDYRNEHQGGQVPGYEYEDNSGKSL